MLRDVYMGVVFFGAISCTVLFPSGASAWEFEMTGQANWYAVRLSQLGNEGFFGPYNIDRGAGTTTGNLSFWNGGLLETDIASGHVAGWSGIFVKFWPVIKINQAIRAQAQYRIGMYGDPTGDNDYWTQGGPGPDNAISEGKWTMFWLTAQTPWAMVAVGKRRWIFGLGLQYDGSDGASTESVVLVAPFGPFNIGFGFYPWRFAGSSTQPLSGFGVTPYGIGPEFYPWLFAGSSPLTDRLDPYDLKGFQSYSRSDYSGSFSRDLLGFATYSAGNLQIGALGVYGSFHIGPEALLGTNPFGAQSTEIFHGSFFTKYTDGRFFFNSETAWLYWTDRFLGQRAQAARTDVRHIEQWRLMTEFGVMAGPAKITLFYSWQPGPDRRNGTLIGKQPAAFVWHPTYDRYLANMTVFRTYAYIFSYHYGSGLAAYNYCVNGYTRDASALAARLDYAAAANLNIFATTFWAERTSDGYPWGCIAPNDAAFNGISNNGNMQLNLGGAPGAPNVPDRALGYEIDAGFEWMLLEGWSLTATFGYWQPGKWFNYACIDRSVPSWNVQTPANFFGTRPGKSIDPVVAAEIGMIFRF